MKVVTKNGEQGVVEIRKETQSATVTVNGVTRTVAFVRDNKKVIVKNDMILHDGDLAVVRQELSKFIKKVDDDKKKRRK